MSTRRLVDTLPQVELREHRRLNLEGEVLPPTESALAPYDAGSQLAAQQRPVPVIVLTGGKPVYPDRLPAAEAAPSWEVERRTPNRTPTVETDVSVPVLQAFYTALAFGIMAGLLAWAAGWSWRVPVVVLALALAIGWLWRLRLVDGLLWKVESITRTDLTGDNQVGPPVPQHAFTVANPAEARSEAAADVRQQQEDQRRAELLAFVDRCLLVGCSESAQGIKASDRADYLRLREVLFQLGIAAWKNPEKPKAGWGLVVSHERARQIIARHVL